MLEFMFATGIEGSNPTIQGGRHRVDQFELCRHYDLWRSDFDLVQGLGVRYLRYGPQIHRVYLGAERYDWGFTDEAFGDLHRRGLTPIADLCHFGVPDWIGDFQNPEFPQLFAAYAGAFARRYPWIRLYTPINEMLICAAFSARYGWWNEQLASDQAFVTALKHLVKANVLAMEAISQVNPNAVFIQSESTEQVYPATPDAIELSEFVNRLRFVSLDLNYGRHVDAGVYQYLLENGMTPDEYRFFRRREARYRYILGNDYYLTNEHWIHADGRLSDSGEVCGYDDITRQYFDRYRLPVMHTETNHKQGPRGDEAVDWLQRQWAKVLRLRVSGVPIIGFTWYSLTDQVDWDVWLREANGRPTAVGLYDLDRNIRPVGTAYRELIAAWREAMATRTALATALWLEGGRVDGE